MFDRAGATASFLINVMHLKIITVKRLLDHSNIKVTDKHYVDLSLSRVRKELDDMEFDDIFDEIN